MLGTLQSQAALSLVALHKGVADWPQGGLVDNTVEGASWPGVEVAAPPSSCACLPNEASHFGKALVSMVGLNV